MNEVGVPQSVAVDGPGGWAEFVFNDLSGSPTRVSAIGSGSLYPSGISAGEGVIIQQITNDPAIRVSVDNRSHKSGGISHDFYRGPRYLTIEALVIGSKASRALMGDQLQGLLQTMMLYDGIYLWKPSSSPMTVRNLINVRHYEALKVQHSTSTTGQVQGVAAPKTALMTLVAGNWAAQDYSGSGVHGISIAHGTSQTVPNGGNTDAYPIITIFGNAHGGSDDTLITNTTTGYSIKMLGTGALAIGENLIIDMLNETIIYSTTGGSALVGMYIPSSDFWTITPGGNSISVDGSTGTQDIAIASHDTWA